ncbi:uncharacterized protein WCC33_018837 [Rhinophrynus dorsalis]
MQSVIKRTKETPNVHPMSRDLSPRRKFGPAIYNKSPSQDRLIEELHGRFGIDKQETCKSPEDNWLTEGVIITSRPTKNLNQSEQQIEKIIIPPDSPQLIRKTFSVTASPPGTVQRTRLVSQSTSPALPSPALPSPALPSPALPSSHLPPPPPPLPPVRPPLPSPAFSPFPPQPMPPWKPSSDDYQDLSKALPPPLEDLIPSCQEALCTAKTCATLPARPLPPSKSCVSIGCQTDDNPHFPPIQAGDLLNPYCVIKSFCKKQQSMLFILH